MVYSDHWHLEQKKIQVHCKYYVISPHLHQNVPAFIVQTLPKYMNLLHKMSEGQITLRLSQTDEKAKLLRERGMRGRNERGSAEGSA